jgi:hypothetical protein
METIKLDQSVGATVIGMNVLEIDVKTKSELIESSGQFNVNIEDEARPNACS